MIIEIYLTFALYFVRYLTLFSEFEFQYHICNTDFHNKNDKYSVYVEQYTIHLKLRIFLNSDSRINGSNIFNPILYFNIRVTNDAISNGKYISE